MTIRQLYYTSCVNAATGTAGFQIKAASAGLTAEHRERLQRILGYRIPRDLDRDALDTHPVSLRYQYIDAQNCYLLCTRSCGADEVGRPGNFFAHCVVAAAEEFAVTAPIEYWQHPFWRASDSAQRSELPEEASLDLQPSLDFDCIWPFLAVGRRREWLAKLLGALLHFERDRRPLILLDTPDNTACWIACLTFALPARFRVLVSFATYHHDPYQAPFAIIGTTADGQFRFSADEYVSHFVLNVPAEQISSGSESAYARVVAPWMSPEHYENEMLGFFEFCATRQLAGATTWGAGLDAAAELYLALFQPQRVTEPARLLGALEPVIASLEAAATLDEEQLEDLHRVRAACGACLHGEGGLAFLSVYARVIKLAAGMRDTFYTTLQEEIERLLHMAPFEPPPLVEGVAAVLMRAGGADWSNVALSHEAVDASVGQLSRGGGERLTLAWAVVTPVMRQLGSAWSQWLRSLGEATLVNIQACRSPEPEGSSQADSALLATLVKALRTQQERVELLTLASKIHGGGAAQVLLELYLALTRGAEDRVRDALRLHVSRVHTGFPAARLYAAELVAEMREAPLEKLGAMVEKTMTRWKPVVDKGDEFLARAILSALSSQTPKKQAEMAGQLLVSARIRARLPAATGTQLANIHFHDFSPDGLEPGQLAVAEAFAQDPGLSAQLQAILMEAIAMTRGEMSDPAREAISRRLANLSVEKYEAEAQKLIQRFFQHDVSLDSHCRLLQTVYSERHRETFWPLYWEGFREAAATERGARHVIKVLGFWFDKSLEVFSDRPYVGPQFFLQLPEVLAGIAQRSQFKAFVAELGASQHKWVDAVEPFIASKGGFLGMFKR